MIPDARAYPGIPQGNGHFENGAVSSFTLALPTPPAGTRQYLAMVIVTFRPCTATKNMNITLGNLDIGAGALTDITITTLTTDSKSYQLVCSPWWPASALATALQINVSTSDGTLFNASGQVVLANLFGYNVAE